MFSRRFLTSVFLLALPLGARGVCDLCTGSDGDFNPDNTFDGGDGGDSTCQAFADDLDVDNLDPLSGECIGAQLTAAFFCCGEGIQCFEELLDVGFCASENEENCCDDPLLGDDGGDQEGEEVDVCDQFSADEFEANFDTFKGCCAPCVTEIDAAKSCLSNLCDSQGGGGSGSPGRMNLFVSLAAGLLLVAAIFGEK